MSKAKGSQYLMRIIISLLEGKWKTVYDIAIEWHKDKNRFEQPYRDALKFEPWFKSRPKYPHSKRKEDLEYSLNLEQISMFLAETWELDQEGIRKLLKSPFFRNYVKSREKKLKDESTFLGELYQNYAIEVLVKNKYPGDKDLIKEINKKWEESNPEAFY